jgi:putative membrane protein
LNWNTPVLKDYLTGLPAFGIYFATAIAMVAAFGGIYTLITRHHEFTLLRRGCSAAVPAFLGALVGYVLPLTTAMQHSANWFDFVIWAVVGAVVQILAYLVACLVMPGLSKRISDDDIPSGILLGGIALVFGMINSASMTP